MAFRDYILHNFWWKLLSLLVAALTWLWIETEFRNEEKSRETPIVAGDSSKSFTLVMVKLLSSATNAGRFTVSPVTVTVTVNGKLENLKKLQAQDIQAFVDVTEVDDAMKFQKLVQVQAPKDLSATADPPKVNLERAGNAK